MIEHRVRVRVMRVHIGTYTRLEREGGRGHTFFSFSRSFLTRARSFFLSALYMDVVKRDGNIEMGFEIL